MLNPKELSRDPIQALKQALSQGTHIAKGNAKIGDVKKAGHALAAEITVVATVIKKCASRIHDPDVRDVVLTSVEYGDGVTLDSISAGFHRALTAIVAYELDDHFIDDEAVTLFDEAELDEQDKSEIRELMAKARVVVNNTSVLPDWQRRKLLHHISKIENELHKEKSNFQTFLAASGDVIGLVKKFGDDVQPVADAIEKARTVTEKKVECFEQLTAEEAPRQLPKPQPETE